MASNNRREQTSKATKRWPKEKVQQMQELRRSGAAGIHKNQGEYRRKPKHVGKGWDE